MSDPYSFGALAPVDEAAEAEAARVAAALRMRQAARPVGGRKEGELTAALSDPATVFNASPLGALRTALTATNEGNYGDAAMAVAPYAVPFAGPAIRGATRMLTAAPKVAAGAVGTGAALTAADAGERTPASPEWWRSQREPQPTVAPFVAPGLTPEEAQRYTAPLPPGFDSLGPQGKRDATARRDAAQERLTKSRDAFLKEKVDRARADWDASLQGQQSAYDAEQARLDKEDQAFKLANQSTREAYPYASGALQAGGAAAAFALPRWARGQARTRNDALVGQVNEAMAEADAAKTLGKGGNAVRNAALARLRAATGASGVGRMTDPTPTLSSTLAAGGLGAVEGAFGALAPYIADSETLPMGSHGREESSDIGNWIARGATGALPGALLGMYGARIPMAGGAIPDLARAEGLKAALQARGSRTPAATPRKRTTRKQPSENVVPFSMAPGE